MQVLGVWRKLVTKTCTLYVKSDHFLTVKPQRFTLLETFYGHMCTYNLLVYVPSVDLLQAREAQTTCFTNCFKLYKWSIVVCALVE